FAWLQRDHASDPTVATAILRDDLYMHVKPGRDTDKLYLLPENEKLQLLVRASVEKNASGAKPLVRSPAASRSSAATTKPSTVASPAHPTSTSAATPAEAAPEPPPMEDWWLARDSQGHTGWLLGRRMDVDVPDDLTRYSEGQRIVGAYVLATVHDPDIDQTAAGGNIKEYVTVLSAPHDGLPYDFDQVRVYTWNLKKHRYETAYRERDIEGFLPVTLKDSSPYPAAPNASPNANPQFTIRIAPANAGPILTDPVTGISRPAKLLEKSFQLEGNVVRRILPPGQTASQQPAEAHPEPLPGKKAKAATIHRKHRK
ncbi:MAG: SH3 domain-containing protein, partial [Acidobacteriaceae bacterium]